jgi:hypothetical protein
MHRRGKFKSRFDSIRHASYSLVEYALDAIPVIVLLDVERGMRLELADRKMYVSNQNSHGNVQFIQGRNLDKRLCPDGDSDTSCAMGCRGELEVSCQDRAALMRLLPNGRLWRRTPVQGRPQEETTTRLWILFLSAGSHNALSWRWAILMGYISSD